MFVSAPTDVEIAEIVDRHNYHRANVAPTATNMLKMVRIRATVDHHTVFEKD